VTSSWSFILQLLDYVWLEQNKKGITVTTLTHHETDHLSEPNEYKSRKTKFQYLHHEGGKKSK